MTGTRRNMPKMEASDVSWISFIASLDQFDSNDALLDALLGSSNDPEDQVGQVHPENRNAMLTSTTATVASSADQRVGSSLVTSDSSSRAKRKRIRSSRPIHEIRRLRLSVQELEKCIALHKQRKLTASPVASSAEQLATAHASDLWGDVAERQYKYLRESQVKNQGLREQVQRQVDIIRSMIRLVQRAQRGLLSAHVTNPLPGIDVAAIARRRESLFFVASEMHERVDEVFCERPFADMEYEFREIAITNHRGDGIPPGTVLATTSVGRIVPQRVVGLSDLLWNVNQSEQAAEQAFKIEHRDESASTQSFVYSVHIQTPFGSVQCQGVGLRARFQEQGRDVVITTGSMWPHSNTPSPLNALAYDFKEWAVVQPRHIGGEMQEHVLVQFETSRPVHANFTEHLTKDQGAVLRFFIPEAHNFIVEQEQRRIDAILLGQLHIGTDGGFHHVPL